MIRSGKPGVEESPDPDKVELVRRAFFNVTTGSVSWHIVPPDTPLCPVADGIVAARSSYTLNGDAERGKND